MAGFGYRPRKRRLLPRRRADVMLAFVVLTLLFALYERFAPLATQLTVSPEENPTVALPLPTAAPDSGTPVDESEVKAGAPVRFLMMNVQNYFVSGEQQRSRYTLYPKKEEAREAVADSIAAPKPEIVGLVEMGGPKALDDLAARLAARGLDYPYRKVLPRTGEDRALALLSMHPIVSDDSRAEVPLMGSHKRKMLRGILDVTLKVPDGRRFRVVGVHLKSHKGETEAATAALRTQEARTLALYLRETSAKAPKMPLLVYGDWNDGPADASLRVLSQGITKESALKRLQPVDADGDAWTHYYREGGQYLIYDQIYVNSVLNSRMGRKSQSGVQKFRPGVQGSDHRAVWCELH